MTFVNSDGGRASSKRARQNNDCTVRALALATDIEYDVAYDILKKAGRRCSSGFDFKKWALSANVNNCRFVWKSFPAVKGQRRMNPPTFVSQFKKGTYIVSTAKHVFTVKDGVMYDTFESHPDRCIYGCWEVVRSGTNEPDAPVAKRRTWTEKNTMPRAEQIKLIEKLANKDVMENELKYRMELDRDEPEEGEAPYDMFDAFDDTWNFMECNFKDCERSFIENMRTIAIAIGWYVEITDEEMDRMITTRGKKYAFRFKGKKYIFSSHGGE